MQRWWKTHIARVCSWCVRRSVLSSYAKICECFAVWSQDIFSYSVLCINMKICCMHARRVVSKSGTIERRGRIMLLSGWKEYCESTNEKLCGMPAKNCRLRWPFLPVQRKWNHYNDIFAIFRWCRVCVCGPIRQPWKFMPYKLPKCSRPGAHSGDAGNQATCDTEQSRVKIWIFFPNSRCDFGAEKSYIDSLPEHGKCMWVMTFVPVLFVWLKGSWNDCSIHLNMVFCLFHLGAFWDLLAELLGSSVDCAVVPHGKSSCQKFFSSVFFHAFRSAMCVRRK